MHFRDGLQRGRIECKRAKNAITLMPFRFRICQNDTTAALRKLFDATPLRVPEASVQPLLVIAEKNGQTDKRGELRHLLSDKTPLPLQLKEEPVANVNLEKTRSMDWDFGINLLDGIFKGFNLPAAAISAKLDNAREISLSFKNVRRRLIDKNELGTALQHRRLDLAHPSAQLFLGSGAHSLLLVTDVIVSNGFAVNVVKTRDNSGKVEVPAIQEIVGEARANVEVKSSASDTIEFQGQDYLTFAFTCVKLLVNPQTGDLSVGTTVITRKSASGEGTEQVEVPQPVELDDDEFEPGLMEWA